MKLRLGIFSFILLLCAASCADPKTEPASESAETELDLSSMSLPEKVDALIENDRYEEALTALEAEEVSPEVLLLKEKTHLNYGIYMVYNADPSQMRENANNGLRQFIAVLDINRNNDKAISEIDNIMMIYKSMNRAPEEDVVEGLKRLGLNY